MAETFSRENTRRLIRAGAGFVLVLTLFFSIEILPLHFGHRQIPWELMGKELAGRLPRILLIATVISVIFARNKQGRTDTGNHHNELP